MKVSKKMLDTFNDVSMLTEKFLIGAGISALVAKVYDKEAVQNIDEDWPIEKKTRYLMTMGTVALAVIAVGIARESLLRATYDYTFKGVDEIDL